MHYFKRNIGDYHKKAGRLSMLQHGAYTLLIDACYDREEFPTLDQALDWCWASSKDEIDAVQFVLSKFFTVEDDLYIQKRISDEIAQYHKNATTNKRIAVERETKRKEKSTKRVRSVNEAPPNQEPLNQEPTTSTEKQRLPFSEIQNAWNEILGDDLGKIRALTDERKKHIKARVNESPKLIDHSKWVEYFSYISQIDFLMGRDQVNPGTGKPFKANLDWVINQSNMNKILEGKYE